MTHKKVTIKCQITDHVVIFFVKNIQPVLFCLLEMYVIYLGLYDQEMQKINKNLQFVCDISSHFFKESAKYAQHCGNTYYNCNFIDFTNIMMNLFSLLTLCGDLSFFFLISAL